MSAGLKTVDPVFADWESDWRLAEAVTAGTCCRQMIPRLLVWADGLEIANCQIQG